MNNLITRLVWLLHANGLNIRSISSLVHALFLILPLCHCILKFIATLFISTCR